MGPLFLIISFKRAIVRQGSFLRTDFAWFFVIIKEEMTKVENSNVNATCGEILQTDYK